MGRSTTLVATAVATLLAAAAAQGQEVVTKNQGEVANPELGPPHCFTASNIEWCLSSNGNLWSLRSPGAVWDIEHISWGDQGYAMEGYVLCVNGAVKAYDTDGSEAGFGPPTVIVAKTASGITIRRMTLDGRFQLDQKWSRDNVERDLTVQMTLKNLGPTASVELGRVTDVNVDYSLDYEFADLFDRTRNTLWFRDPVNGRDAVTMKLLTLNPNYYVIAAVTELWVPRCNYPQLPFPGGPTDVMGHARFKFGSMATGAQRVVKIGYRIE